MNIILVSSEIVPYAKTGGLADVCGALTMELNRLGHNCIAVMPFYKVVQIAPLKNMKSIAEFSIKIGEKYYSAEIIEEEFSQQNSPIWFVKNDHFYNRLGLYGDDKGDYQDNAVRFIFFCKAVLETIKVINKDVDVIHCNDWQTALIPIFMRTIHSDEPIIKKIKTLLTIHNLAYQGLFWKGYFNLLGIDDMYFSPEYIEFYDKINFLKAGILFADKINTVSKKYADEIQTEEYSCGLEGVLKERAKDLTGIINGMDYSIWNPEVDRWIARQYSAVDMSGKAFCKRKLQVILGLPVRTKVPILAFIGRLVEQKGIDLILDIFDRLMEKDIQFVLLGTGQEKYHQEFTQLAKRYSDKCSVQLVFSNKLAHQIYAGADILLMPSRYEPCGSNQLISIKYGTIPIVRKVGGLADTIKDYSSVDLKKGISTGFIFENYNSNDFFEKIELALQLFSEGSFGQDKAKWKQLQLNAMKQDWSWRHSAKEYIKLYKMTRIPFRSGPD